MRNYRHIEVRPISGALGAEIHGVDISRELEDDVVGEMRQAFLDHLVNWDYVDELFGKAG